MSKNCGLPDYAEYHFSLKEGLLAFLEGTVLVAMIGYFFYHSWIACVALIPVFVLFIREKKKDLAKKRRQELSLEFKDLVLALSANMKAGYSVENALGESCRDVELLYGADSPVCREVRHMLRGMENNVVLEKLLYDFGMRSHQPDIRQFAAVSMEISSREQIYSAMVVYGLLTYEDGAVLIPNKELMDRFNELVLPFSPQQAEVYRPDSGGWYQLQPSDERTSV